MKIITLSLLQFLEDNGIGTIDKDLFWEKLGLGENGIYISDLGASQSRTSVRNTMYQIYSRAKDDVKAYQKLQEIADLLNRSYNVCSLPACHLVTDEGFTGVTIMPVSTISNNGQDENGRIIYSITGQIYYSEASPALPEPPDPPDPPGDMNIIATEANQLITTEDNKLIEE